MIYKQPQPSLDIFTVPLDRCQEFIDWAEQHRDTVQCVRFKKVGEDMEISYRIKGAGMMAAG